MMLALLLASAFKSAVLGAFVWSFMKMFRFRDSAAETIIWTGVLFAALLMPLMSKAVPTLVSLPVPWPATPAAGHAIVHVAFVTNGHIADPSRSALWHGFAWLGSHGLLLLWGLYALITIASLARLLAGLAFTARLYRSATTVEAPWAENRRVRCSSRIIGPVSCGSCIILPADYPGWSSKKLAAVLAHEQAHLDRGDFFIQLVAALHRTLFWFSPFAWWLQARLIFLAEAASDEAAVRLLNDRAYYAELLLEMSQTSQRATLMVAMARRASMHQRILQILDDLPANAPAGRARALLVMSILPLAGILAGAHANVPFAVPAVRAATALMQTRLVTMPIVEAPSRIVVSQLEPRLQPQRPKAAQTSGVRNKEAEAAAAQPPAPSSDGDDVGYNPRALLQTSSAAIVSTIIPVTSDDRQKANRSAPALLDLRSDDHDSQ